MKTTGSWRTPARFIASWQSPRAEEPSPNQPTATRRSSRMRKASAQPTATGSIAGRWLTIAIIPRRVSADDVHAQVAVERRADVVRPHRRRDADRGGLVPSPRVERPGDLALLVEDVAALLDPAREHHVPVDAEEVVPVE